MPGLATGTGLDSVVILRESGGGTPSASLVELESGSGSIALEDGTGSIQLEG